MVRCTDCKWYDTTRTVGGQDNIPLGSDGERCDFCGYDERVLSFDVERCEHSCRHFVDIFDDFLCKNCAECLKETEGQCSQLMCKNCATCSLKEFGTCHRVKCHDCGYCDYWEYHCYQDTWRESWDIYLVERFSQRVVE